MYINLYTCKEAPRQENNIVDKDNIPSIWIRLPCIGNKDENLLKQLIRKVKRIVLLTSNFKLHTIPLQFGIASQSKTKFQ